MALLRTVLGNHVVALTTLALFACGDQTSPLPINTNSQILLFGGAGADSRDYLTDGDTWTWDGKVWTQLKVAEPNPREGTASARLGNNVVLFGGGTLGPGISDPSSYFADTWTWNGTQWNGPLPVTGPSKRANAAMATLQSRIVLFGGGIFFVGTLAGGWETYADTWTWDGSGWEQLDIAGPSAREGASMAALNDRLYLFGGYADSGPMGSQQLFGDTWSFDGQQWTQSNATGPSPRESAAMTTWAGKILLFGGQDASANDLSDTWAWDGEIWTELDSGSGPSARSSVALAPYQDKVVLFGGVQHSAVYSFLADTWIWDGTWTHEDVPGPSARGEAMMLGP